jgi:carbon storage regulator CsrA
MLVLTRKPGETIVIPELGITVKVLKVRGERVSVGVVAQPKHKVLRGEILDVDAPREKVAEKGGEVDRAA